MEEEMNPNSCTRSCIADQKKTRPEEQLNCPRCKSTNTKFCYYNNYSLTQPRYFCKSCRRYWTEGGSLRNVPIGGASRKNRKSVQPSPSSSSSDHFQTFNPKFPEFPSGFCSESTDHSIYEAGKDLNLAFPHYTKVENMEANCDQISAVELLRGSGIGSRGLNSFIPNLMPHSNPEFDVVNPYPSGFSFPDEFKPNLAMDEADQNERQGNSPGFWSGMLGGGSL